MARRTVSKLVRTLQNLGLSAATVVVFLGGAEIVCRILERADPPRPVAPYIGDWLREWGGDFYTVSTTAVGQPPWNDYNGDGLRDREHDLRKPPGTRRVVCLGDSTTLGFGLRSAEAYPQVLEGLLHAYGRDVEVFNVALWGWSTRQEHIAYRRIARRYSPDHVLLGVCLNDIPELQNNLARPPRFLGVLHEHSALVRKLVRARDREIHDVEELFAQANSAKVREGFSRFFSELRALRDDVQVDGASFSVLVFPFRSQVAPGAPPPVAQETILDFCRAEGIDCLDLLPVLRPVGEAAFGDYDHFSAVGSSAVARAVLDWDRLPEALAPRRPRTPAAQPPRGTLSLVSQLGSADAEQRVRAARALGEAADGGRAVSEALLHALDDAAPEVRGAAAWAIGGRGDSGAVGALARRLGDDSPLVRGAAAAALGRIGPPARPAGRALVERLGDADPTVRWRAVVAIEAVGLDVPSCLPRLIDLLHDPRGAARAEAAAVVGKLGAAAAPAVPALTDALSDDRPVVRSAAVLALGQLGPAARPAVPSLLEAFRDPDLRWRVALTLGTIGPDAAAAVPQLVAALEDASSPVRWQAIKALGKIGPAARTAAPALVAASRRPEAIVRRDALVSLCSIGADSALVLGALRRAAGDEDPAVRRVSAQQLGELGPAGRQALPTLVALLEDRDPRVRNDAARTLERMRPLPEGAERALVHASTERRLRREV